MTQTIKIRNERGDITTNTTEIHRILKKTTMNNSMPTNLHNLKEIITLQETENMSRLNQEYIENLNKSVMSQEVEPVIKNLSMHKTPRPHDFKGEFYQPFKE